MCCDRFVRGGAPGLAILSLQLFAMAFGCAPPVSREPSSTTLADGTAMGGAPREDTLYATVLVVGKVAVRLTDPKGRQNAWLEQGEIAEIPDCSQFDVTETDIEKGAGDPAMFFALRRVIAGRYVIHVRSQDEGDVTCNVDWQGPGSSTCGNSDARWLKSGDDFEWYVEWPAASSESCVVILGNALGDSARIAK